MKDGAIRSAPISIPEVVTLGESMGCLLSRGRADNSEITFIGAESNVAIGLASLGHSALWISRLGDDRMGDYILEALHERGVATHVARDPVLLTGVAVKELGEGPTVVRYYRRQSAAASMGRNDVPDLNGATWLHLTGITPALSPSCRELVESLAHQTEPGLPKLSLDVNLRSTLWDDLTEAQEVIRRLCARASLIFVGDDEAEALGLGSDIESFRASVNVRPDCTVVFKRGSYGAEASVDGVVYRQPAVATDVLDVTGAGDAFAAGFLGAQLDGWDADVSLRLGNLMAAHVIRTDLDFVAEVPPDFRAEMKRLALVRGSDNLEQR